MLAFFLVSGLSGQPTNIQDPDKHYPIATDEQILNGRVIAVDPGHGGSDPGTIGVSKSTEAENVLAIAWDLKGMLEHAGATVIMTRKNDINPASGTSYQHMTNGQLAVRTAIANRNNAEIFISIHNDWNSNSSISGTTSYYYYSRDWILADCIQRSLVECLGTQDIGVQRGNFYVLRNTNMPSALVEVGFLSNRREAELLAQPWYRKTAAQAIFYGIVDYYVSAGIIS